LLHALGEVKSALGGELRPLDLLLAVMRHEAFDVRIRVKAAKIAARYIHRKQRAEPRRAPDSSDFHSVPIAFAVRRRHD
jgi:hypothetical protein